MSGFKATGAGIKEGAYVAGSRKNIAGHIARERPHVRRPACRRPQPLRGSDRRDDDPNRYRKSNGYELPRHRKTGGSQTFEPATVVLTDPTTWYSVYSVASAILPPAGRGPNHGDPGATAGGGGPVALRKRFFVQRSTGAITVVKDTGEGFASGTGLKVQVVAGSNTAAAVVQVRWTSGTVTMVEVVEASSLVASATLRNGGA